MPKSRASRGILLTSNLPQLQNLIKRDPAAYRAEFLTQHNHYLSLLRLFTVSSGGGGNGDASSGAAQGDAKSAAKFAELITFVCQLAACYPNVTRDLPAQLRGMLLGDGAGGVAVTGDVRETVVKNLVMLRNKDVIDSIELLQVLLPLLPHVPKALRSLIRRTILTDLKTANARSKNHRLNRVVQGLLFGMVEAGMGAEVVGDKGRHKATRGGDGGEAMWAVMMVRELWRKGVWTDAKTVSIAALAAFHPSVKVQAAAMHFFLGSEADADRDDSEDEDEVAQGRRDVKGLEHKLNVGAGGRKRTKELERARKSVKVKRKERAAGVGAKVNFPALELLHDPQTFGEKLYDNLHKHDKQYSLEHKVLIMQLLSRVMGAHKLCVLGFYSYIIKYLTYHQLQVTLILVSLAQSVHDLTPPDVLVPVITKLAHEFVHPGVGAEVVAAGINAIREVCRRQPWAMDEDLLGDLVEYKKSRDKGVATAAGGLLALFREVNPAMLKRRDRGKAVSMGIGEAAPAYGHGRAAAEGIEGLELLEEHFAALRKEANGGVSDDDAAVDEDDEGGWDDWEVESETGSESSGWVDVSDDERDIEMSGSEDEDGRKAAKAAKAKAKAKGKRKAQDGDEEDGDEDEDEDADEDGDGDDAKSVMTEATEASQTSKKLSLLAQQKILTPADFALLAELRLKAAQDLVSAGGGTAAKRKLAALEASKKHVDAAGGDAAERFLTTDEILGPRKRAKQDYEERMASVRRGREGREKFGSKMGSRREGKATSNKEKKRNKPIMMAVHSNQVMAKKKASLRDKQIRLRAAIDKQKKMKH
ncbi:Severe Depolymerization of Actin [Cryptotrichosporon argae]